MPPRSKIGGHIVFVLSVILLFRHSVLFSETLTLQITFEQWVLELWYFTWIFPVIGPLFFALWPWPWSLTHFLKTSTLIITFEQWVLELSYCTWAFLVTRSSYWYKGKCICPCVVCHLLNWPLSGAFVFQKNVLFAILLWSTLREGDGLSLV